MLDARDIPIHFYYEALERLEVRMLSSQADNMLLTGLYLQMFPDGSSFVKFLWKENKKSDTSEQKMLATIFGAGETEEEFQTIELLRDWLIDRGVWED
jgi:hypothetical protein